MQISWKQTFAVWWSLFWRSTVLAFVVGCVIGGIIGIGLAAKGYSPNEVQELIQRYNLLIGYVIGVIASIAAVKLAIQKHLPSLAAAAEAQAGAAPPATDGDRFA